MVTSLTVKNDLKLTADNSRASEAELPIKKSHRFETYFLLLQAPLVKLLLAWTPDVAPGASVIAKCPIVHDIR